MIPPMLTSFASPQGGSLPWGGPAGGLTPPKLTSFASPRGGGLPWGGPAGGLIETERKPDEVA